MKNFNKVKKSELYKSIQYLMLPIIGNAVFFINIILLLIVPELINALIVNSDIFIIKSNESFFGFIIGYGAGIPYIFFIPFVVSYVLCLILTICHRFNYKLQLSFKCLIYLFLLIIFCVNVFVLINFKCMLTPSILMLMAETNGGEISDFIRTYFFSLNSLIAYTVIVISVLCVHFSEKYCRKINPLFNNIIITVFLFMVSIYMFQRSIDPIHRFVGLFNCKDIGDTELWTINFVPDTNTLTGISYSFYTIYISKKEMDKAIQITINKKNISSSKSNVNIVLVIGESFNKYHSNLYGYKLNTNPYLMNEHKKGNLFLFNNVITSYNLTTFSIRNIFSTNSIMNNERWSDCPAFPFLFKSAGFNVYFWDNQIASVTNQATDFSLGGYLHNIQLAKVSYTECNTRTYHYDSDLIHSFFSYGCHYKKKSLVIFHLLGQHFRYSIRYPQLNKFVKFNIKNIKRKLSDDQKETIAQYANATLYNDYVLNEIITHYRNSESVIVYFPDHGEEVYDYRDFCGRTHNTIKTRNELKYQYEIPFMVWCSDCYIKLHPDKIALMKKAKNKPFMNDNACQILFGLCDMKTKYYKPERDLFSSQFKPYKHRIVQDEEDYDIIMKDNR